ncbi:MAG TPA: hypothetical protein VGG01_05515 [Xanthobacteraceae bacterium]|jgi:hypothetical protein
MGRLIRGRFLLLSRAALLAGVGALAGCTSSLPDFGQFKVPTTRSFLPENMDTYVPPASARSDRPVGPGDLVDGQGACAGGPSTVAAAPAAPAPSPAAPEPAEAELSSPANAPAGAKAAPAPPMLGTVGLDMTECEVVRAIGQPQSVNIRTGERGQREVTMTYMGNERAGTYLFRNGRLSSLERGPEPPPPPKAEKPKKKKKPVVKKKPQPPQPPAT